MEGLEETAALLNQAIDDVEGSFSKEMNDIKRIYGYVVFPFNLGLFAHTFKRVVIDTFNNGGKAAAVEDQVLLWMSLFGILFKFASAARLAGAITGDSQQNKSVCLNGQLD